MVTTKSSTLHTKQTNVMMLPLSSHDTNSSSVDKKVRKEMETYESLGSRILLLTLLILKSSIFVLCQGKSTSKNVHVLHIHRNTNNVLYKYNL